MHLMKIDADTYMFQLPSGEVHSRPSRFSTIYIIQNDANCPLLLLSLSRCSWNSCDALMNDGFWRIASCWSWLVLLRGRCRSLVVSSTAGRSSGLLSCKYMWKKFAILDTSKLHMWVCEHKPPCVLFTLLNVVDGQCFLVLVVKI